MSDEKAEVPGFISSISIPEKLWLDIARMRTPSVTVGRSMDHNLTVEEYIFDYASESELSEMADESNYWQSCYDFIDENRDRLIGELSFKQRMWLSKIKEDLLS